MGSPNAFLARIGNHEAAWEIRSAAAPLIGCVLLGELDAARFAGDCDADLAGVLQGLFDFARDVAGEDKRLLIVNLVGLSHNPQLPAGVDAKRWVHDEAGE